MSLKLSEHDINLLICGTIFNLIGRTFAGLTGFPGLLNVTGTMYAAYFGGPAVGAFVAIISSAISSIFVHRDLYGIFVEFIFALLVAFSARKNKYISRFFSVLSLAMTLGIARAIPMTVVNVNFFEGKTGLFLPDATIDFLNVLGTPFLFRSFMGTFYYCFTDTLIGLLLIFFVRLSVKQYTKRKNAMRLKKALGKKATLGLLLACTLALPSINVKAEDIGHENYVAKVYNNENGLVGGCANDIVQTSDGSMWVGTYGGLYRFNGKDFQLLNNFNSVRSVQCLHVDEADRLWVGTNGSGITVLDDMLNAYIFDESNGLMSNTVHKMVEDTEHRIYVATTNGVAVVHYEDGKVVVDKEYPEIGNVESISSNAGKVVAVNMKGQIAVYSPSDAEPVSFIKEGATCATMGNDGALYVGTDYETICKYRLSDGNYVLEKEVAAEGLIYMHSIHFTDSGYAYITSDSGIGTMDVKMNVTFFNPGGFDSAVEVVYEDYQGNIWFTSYRRGLLCLSKSSFIDLFSLSGVAPSVVNAIHQIGNKLYVGTDDGLVIIDKNKMVSIENDVTEFYKNSRVRSMTEDADGNLIILGYGKDLMAVSKTGELFPYLSEGEFVDRRPRFVYTMASGEVVISAESGLHFIKNRRLECTMELSGELSSAQILNVYEMDDGSLLAGSDGDGLEIIKNHTVTGTITKKDGLCSNVILRVVDDKQSDGIFVMTGSGFCYVSKDFEITEINNIPFYNNYDMYQAQDGTIFIMGGAGIYVIRYDAMMSGATAEAWDLLDIKSGLPGNLTSNAWNAVDDDGIIYLCGSTGVYRLNINNYSMNVNNYKSKITGITLDNKYVTITSNDEIVIPKGVKKIGINVELNNFTPTDPYVRYYLYGIDQAKTKVLSSALGTISYFNLPQGQYDFHIEVLDENNRIINEKVYSIIKEKEIYETTAFRVYFYSVLIAIILVIAASAINGAVYMLTKRQSAEHELIVRKLQDEKTQALEKALHMEEEANKMKSEFLANMSHEIRTPINAIIGMGTMITRESKEQSTKRYARDIRNASKTLLALINDILDFSKIESGNLELVMGEYDLGVLVNDLVNMIQPKADDKKLDFIVNVDENIPKMLYGDDVRIEQIIINILNNAVKYTNQGSVSFNMGYEQVSEDQIELKVSITDTGIGIKEEDIEKLFSPYQRFDERRNKKVEGTGLGMSITKSLLEKMNSALNVTSVYGKGSTFAFTVLQSVCGEGVIGNFRENNDFNDRENEIEKFHAKEAVILVVDDVEMNLIVAKNLLKRILVQIDTASSGTEAIEMAKNRKYDIIFMDAMMPDLSGEESMQRIRQECKINWETPIIVLTANAIKGAREEYIEAGFDDYLSKPIDGIQFEDIIEKYLPEGKIEPVTEGTAFTVDDEQKKGTIEDVFRKELFMDVDMGIEASGDEDTYLIVCRSFYDTAVEKIKLIRKYFETKDVKNYTIQVHALKSSARLIGATDLSEKAYKLEMAGKENDMEYINANTEEVLFIYKYLYDRMNSFYSAVEEKAKSEAVAYDNREPISESDLEDAFSALKELSQQMDYDGAKSVLDMLADYKLPDEAVLKVDELNKALKNFDWDTMEAVLG